MVSPSIKEITGTSDPYRYESWFENIHPQDLPKAMEANRRALERGESYSQQVRVYHSQKERWIWVHTASTPVFDARGNLTHFNGLIIDITEQKRAEEALQSVHKALEQRVEERTRELSILLEVSHNVASTLELEPLLGLILDQLKAVVDYRGASILILEGEDLVLLAHRGPIPQEEALRLSFPLEDAWVNREVIRRREPVIVPDVRGDAPLARAFRETAGGELETTFNYIRSWMGIPLTVKDRVIGMLSLDHAEANYYSPRQAELALVFANQAAVAIDNARLYQAEQKQLEEVERRRQIAEGLREILATLNSSRPLTEILDFIVAQVIPLLGANAGVIYHIDSNTQEIIIESASGMPEEFMAIGPIPLSDTKPNEATLNRQPYAVTDLETAFATYSASRSSLPPQVQAWIAVVRAHFGSYLSVPLIVNDKVYGAVSIFYHKPQEFSDEEIKLALAFSDQAALAIENARLHQTEQSRQRELQTLLDVAAAASSSLELDEMLSTALDRVVALVGASRAGVMLLSSESGKLEPRIIRPERPIVPENLTEMCQVCSEVIASGKPLYVPVDAALGHIEPGALLPLRVRGQPLGVLVIIGPQESTFSERHLALFESIADELGIAVENARLYKRVEQVAIAAERSRLARDLHDSVTQSLYSMTLFAEAARRLIVSEDQESVEEYVSQLCETSQQALKEMRLLVYELRPSTLEEEGLVRALRQRLDTVERRAGIEAQLSVQGELDLPKKNEEELYRIAQEALNNSLKHAAATAVTVRIATEGGLLTMEIADNGRGFDLDSAADTGGIGLSSMQERAEKLNSDLQIVSIPEKGTRVQVQVKAR